jgi:replicative DNA helicase
MPTDMPQDLSAEASVLGAIILDNEAFTRVNEILMASHFYLPSHRRIFEVMAEMFSSNEPIDVLTLSSFPSQKRRVLPYRFCLSCIASR